MRNFKPGSDNELSDENADSDGKIIATLGRDCKVYRTPEGNRIVQRNLLNYKIRTMDDICSKPLSSLTVPSSVVDLGKKMLQYARDSNVAGVRSTLSRGAAFTADWLGMTALHFAVMNDNIEICEMVLNGGANKDMKTKVDRTPLHLACYYGHYRIVELLIDRKCNVNAQDMLCMTPLHWAVEKHFKLIVRLLIRSNADVSVVSKFGRTPIAIAVLTEQPDVLEELKAAKFKQISRIFNEQQEKETSNAVDKIDSDKCKRLSSGADQPIKTELPTTPKQSQTGDFNDIPLIENIKEETGIIPEPDIALFQSPTTMSPSNDEDTCNVTNDNMNGISSTKKDRSSISINGLSNDLINSNSTHAGYNNTNSKNQTKSVNNHSSNNSSNNNSNNNYSHHNSNGNVSSKVKSIVPVRLKSGKMSPLQRITYVNKIKPNIISRHRNLNASTTITNTTKGKNIRIISLNDFNKLYGDTNLKNVQKLQQNLNNSSFICSQRIVSLRDLQSKPQKLRLPMTNGVNSGKVTATNNNNSNCNTIKKNIINHNNNNNSSSNNKTITGSPNSSLNQNTKASVNILNGTDFHNLSTTSESDNADGKQMPARNASKLDTTSSSSTSNDGADTASAGNKPVHSAIPTKSLRLLPARCLEQYFNLKLRHLPTSATIKQYGGNARQSIGERKCITTASTTGNPPTTVLPLLTLPEICRQLLELRRQNDELRRKYELSQRDKDDLKKRVQRLEEFLIDPKSNQP